MSEPYRSKKLSEPLESDLETPDPRPTERICYYSKAMNLQSVAEELLADGRANNDPDVIATTRKLLSLVDDIRADNATCWDYLGACPSCPEPNFKTENDS